MAAITIDCPGCRATLNVPEDSVGKRGRCRECGESFTIAPPIEQLEAAAPEHADETIATWLGDLGPVSISDSLAPSMAKSGPVREFSVRLEHVDTMGAFFLFDSRLLYDPDFRSSFPMSCVLCGSRSSLSGHLIAWGSKLAQYSRAAAQVERHRSVFNLEKFGPVAGRELLAKLPRIGNLPEPYCLPFPYYICDSCSAVGAVMTDVHKGPDGQGEECELGIASLAQAEKFTVNVAGANSELHKGIHEARRESRKDPWRLLPLGVRIRINRWYEQGKKERFIAYFPDSDYSKAEAGLAGLVLTDQRLVFHKSVAQVEIPLTERIAADPTTKGEYVQLEITGAGKTAKLNVAPAAAKQIRSLLSSHRPRARVR